jgi:hypothetical protein
MAELFWALRSCALDKSSMVTAARIIRFIFLIFKLFDFL